MKLYIYILETWIYNFQRSHISKFSLELVVPITMISKIIYFLFIEGPGCTKEGDSTN